MVPRRSSFDSFLDVFLDDMDGMGSAQVPPTGSIISAVLPPQNFTTPPNEGALACKATTPPNEPTEAGCMSMATFDLEGMPYARPAVPSARQCATLSSPEALAHMQSALPPAYDSAAAQMQMQVRQKPQIQIQSKVQI